MLQTKICTNVYSDMSTWPDFCVVFHPHTDLEEAEKIVQKAYNDWWELPDEQFEPIADYIIRCLTENKVEYKIYVMDKEREGN